MRYTRRVFILQLIKTVIMGWSTDSQQMRKEFTRKYGCKKTAETQSG